MIPPAGASRCLPADWTGFELRYRFRETVYNIGVRQTTGSGASVIVDGVLQPDPAIRLVDDRLEHRVEVRLPKRAAQILKPAA